MGIAYVLVTTVLFLFPPELPTTASSMNYCVVALAILAAIAVLQWLIEGRREYTGPRIDIAALQQGAVMGMVEEGEKPIERSAS